MLSSQAGRVQQRRRTRQALLDAATELLAEGLTPTVTEVSRKAQVSRATAYRYFPSQDQLLLECVVAGMVRPTDELFEGEQDVERRVEIATRAFFDMVVENQTEFRNYLRLAMTVSLEDDEGVPRRQGRRVEFFVEALAPIANELGRAGVRRLSRALSLCTGVEALVAMSDVCGLSPREGRRVTTWAARALVREALREAPGSQA